MTILRDLRFGLFVFNHETLRCCTTLVVDAARFIGLNNDPVCTQGMDLATFSV